MATKAPLTTGGATGLQEMLPTDTIPLANMPVMTATVGGAVPTPPNDTTKFLRGDGTFAVPAGGGGGSVATDAIWDAKGDLAIGTGANTASRLAVGSDGAQLYADSGSPTGVRWGASLISPAQITADQNNYQPTGWANAQLVMLSTDSESRKITSFEATFGGDTKRIFNVGDYTILIPCEHDAGTATNRVAGKSVYYLSGGDAVDLTYDGNSSRWRLGTKTYYDPGDLHFYGFFSPGSAVVGDQQDFTFTATGTGAVIGTANASFAIPGALTFTLGTTSTGSCYMSHKTINRPYSLSEMTMFGTTTISIPTLSDATNRFSVNFSFDSNPGNNLINNNSILIRYSDNLNGGNWQGVSRSNTGVESTVDLGVVVNAAQVYRLEIHIDKALSQAMFYVDGLYRGKVTTNLPIASQSVGPRLLMLKSTGTTSRTMNIHAMTHGSPFK